MDPNADRETDAALARETAKGSREAFATLYARYHAVVFRYARLMTGSTALSEDVVQDVFLALMRQAHQFDPTRGTLSTYLYAIARYQVRRQLFRQRRLVSLEELEEIETPEIARLRTDDDPLGAALGREETQRLRRAILSLPSRYREVVVLCDVQQMAYAQAAALLGCAVGTIRSRLHRARQLLADKMNARQAPIARSVGSAPATLRCVI